MNRQNTYKSIRAGRWLEHQSSWDRLVASHGVVEEQRWHRATDVPTGRVSRPFCDGLECLCAGQDRHARILLQRAIQNADRLVAENRLHDTAPAEAIFPRSLGEVLQERAYARWLLGEPLDRVAIHASGGHYVSWCLTQAQDRARFTSNVTMDYYLAGIRCALIAFDMPYAKELLSREQRFTYHHLDERLLWVRFAKSCPVFDSQIRDKFDSFFDAVRNPDFRPRGEHGAIYVRHERLALDMGIIRHMYLVNVSPSDRLVPSAVIESVSH